MRRRVDRESERDARRGRQRRARSCTGFLAGLLVCVAAPAARTDDAPPVFAALASGLRHSCAALSDGKVVCWGSDLAGQLGDGDATTGERSIPVQVSGIGNATDVAVGFDFSCALLGDGTIRCWGTGSLGQLGSNSYTSRSSPVAVQGISDAIGIAAGAYHACAALAGGGVKCWGYNISGQLGNATTTTSPVPVAVSSLANATSVAAGVDHSCARLENSTVACWGGNGAGQLGNGSLDIRSLVPVSVASLADAEAIAAGSLFSCARRTSGSVICWGDDYYGQLGDGANLYQTYTRRRQPTFPVVGVSTAEALSAGFEHACATLAGGETRCWGRNDFGTLGDGGYDDTSTPVVVVGLADGERPAAGHDHTCVGRTNGRAVCWGSNFDGQLGDDSRVTRDLSTTADSAVPVAVSGPTMTEIDLGFRTGCGLRRNGDVWCWGESFFGIAIPFDNAEAATEIGAGGEHACAVLADETMACRGLNDVGQLGDGSVADSYFEPVAVVDVTGVGAVSIDSQERHSCAVYSDGSVQCWGSNDRSQLGDESILEYAVAPVTVGSLPTASRVATGWFHSCAVTDTGTVYCWGANESGQLGGGTTEFQSATPVQVPGLSNAVDVSAGTRHTCARLSDGAVRCWGGNDFGQVGSGSVGSSSPPVAPVGLPTVLEVSAGGEHSCALLVDGSIRCWGRNTSGELGDGTLFDSSSPVVVPGIADAWTVRAGRSVTCAGMSKTLPWDVSVRCWGRALNGALGNDYRSGDPVNEPSPIPLLETFSPIRFALTVETHGDGTGRVTSLHPGIDCGSDCSEALPPGSIVRLSATADPPASFYRWAGDADCSDGVVQLEADRHCVALIPEPGSGVALAAGLVLLIRLRRPFAGCGAPDGAS